MNKIKYNIRENTYFIGTELELLTQKTYKYLLDLIRYLCIKMLKHKKCGYKIVYAPFHRQRAAELF